MNKEANRNISGYSYVLIKISPRKKAVNSDRDRNIYNAHLLPHVEIG